jgi:hypothetical protein
MKRVRPHIFLGLMFVCTILFLLAVQYVVKGCAWWDCAPRRSFRVLDLTLPAELFPEGAIVNQLSPFSEGTGALEDAMMVVYWSDGEGIAVYQVFRYPTIRQASLLYPDEVKSYVNPVTGASWKAIDELTFVSSKADEYFTACGYWESYRCGFVARYAEYIIKLNSTIDSRMTYADFDRAISQIEKQIAGHLYP